MKESKVRFIPEYNLFLVSSEIACLGHREQRLVISGDSVSPHRYFFKKFLVKLMAKASSLLPGALAITLLCGMAFMLILMLADVVCVDIQNVAAVMP